MDSIKQKYYKAGAAVGAGLGTMALMVPVALAEGESSGSSAVQTALTGMATSVASEGQTTIAAVLPVMAPLLATVIVVGIGLRFISRIGNRGR